MNSPAQIRAINATDPAALSPYERQLYTEKGIPIRLFPDGVWRRNPGMEFGQPDSTTDQLQLMKLQSFPTAQLQFLSKSSDGATRTAAILILDQRSKQPDTSPV